MSDGDQVSDVGDRGGRRLKRTAREIAFAVRLGLRIAEVRAASGMNQSEFAEKLGVRPLTILRYEKGHTSISFYLLLRMALLLGVPLAELAARPRSIQSC